jgi:tetratricopeptide (TPR) repeat protein
MQKGMAKEAIESFEAAVAFDFNQAQFQGGLYEAVLASGSKAKWEELLASMPTDNPDVLNNAAWALTIAPADGLRDLETALRYAKRSVELFPTDAAWNTLGVAQYYSGDYETALDSLRNSMRMQGAGNVVDWLFTAMAYRKLGKDREASVWYERAVDWITAQSGIDPEYARFRAEADALMTSR